MPYAATIGTYPPCWGTPHRRVAGDGGSPSGVRAYSGGSPALPVTRVTNSDAPGTDAVRSAWFGGASGAIDVALVTGADKLRETASKDLLGEWEAMARDMAWDCPLGSVAPAGLALFAETEMTGVGGALPVNPGGGLTSTGHPAGATDVAQCARLFSPLRGQAVNQVDGARIGLAHNLAGPTAVSAVTTLEGPGEDGK
jgi:acetyl-CoA acetyltransferase